MGGGTGGKLSKQLKSKANDLRIWANWCDIRAEEEYDEGDYWEAAKWKAEGTAARAEAEAFDAAAGAAEKAGL
jgi:hypothetical protein